MFFRPGYVCHGRRLSPRSLLGFLFFPIYRRLPGNEIASKLLRIMFAHFSLRIWSTSPPPINTPLNLGSMGKSILLRTFTTSNQRFSAGRWPA